MPYPDRWIIFDDKSERTILTTYKIKQNTLLNKEQGNSCLRPDPRLSDDHCFSTIYNQMFFMHPGFSTDSKLTNNLLNIDQVNIEFFEYWNMLSGDFLEKWARYGDVTVYTGPIWDKNHDNLADEVKEGDPTHFYFIMKRNGESMSFVLPNYIDTIDCNLDLALQKEQQLIDLLKQHLARIRDVEQLTGLNFEFGDLTIEGVQSRLFIREWADFWNEEDLLNTEENPSTTETSTTTESTTPLEPNTSPSSSISLTFSAVTLFIALFQ